MFLLCMVMGHCRLACHFEKLNLRTFYQLSGRVVICECLLHLPWCVLSISSTKAQSSNTEMNVGWYGIIIALSSWVANFGNRDLSHCRGGHSRAPRYRLTSIRVATAARAARHQRRVCALLHSVPSGATLLFPFINRHISQYWICFIIIRILTY